MTRRVVLAFLLLFAAIGALLFVLREERRDDRKQREEARLLQFDDRSVKAVVATGTGLEARFERNETGWRMTEPVFDAVDPEAVEEILQAAKRSRVLRVLENPETLSSYGLAPPEGSISLEADHPVPRLDLGIEDPTRQGLFARVQGREGVLLLGYPDASVLRSLNPYDLRDRTLTGVISAEVVGITVERGGESVVLKRDADGWWISRPLPMPASDQKVEALLGRLDRTIPKVLDDAGYPPAPSVGLDPPRVRITLDTADERRELRFGDSASLPYLPATRDDRETLMGLDRDALSDLPLDVPSLVDWKLTKSNRYRVVAWQDAAPSGTVSAERTAESRWRSSDGNEIPEDVVLAYLARLLEAPVESVTSGEAPDEETRIIRFRTEDGGEDAVHIHGERIATLDSLPGIVFRLQNEIPPPPDQ
jgi:hypothetical protein